MLMLPRLPAFFYQSVEQKINTISNYLNKLVPEIERACISKQNIVDVFVDGTQLIVKYSNGEKKTYTIIRGE